MISRVIRFHRNVGLYLSVALLVVTAYIVDQLIRFAVPNLGVTPPIMAPLAFFLLYPARRAIVAEWLLVRKVMRAVRIAAFVGVVTVVVSTDMAIKLALLWPLYAAGGLIFGVPFWFFSDPSVRGFEVEQNGVKKRMYVIEGE